MKINYAVVLFLSGMLLLGCSKKYTTKPQLDLKSITSTNLHPGDSIQFIFEARDREGDISQLYIEKKTSNCMASNARLDTLLPGFQSTKDFKATLSIKYGYQSSDFKQLPNPTCTGQNDTCIFRFVLMDQAGNASDTLTSPTIILFR